MDWKRILRHLVMPRWTMRRAFCAATLDAIEQEIALGEKSHRGELRFVVEASLEAAQVLVGLGARARAVEVFSMLRVWDTEENSGVLIYVQWIDRKVEILADRGIAKRVAQQEWDAICRGMEEAFAAGSFEAGSLQAVRAAGSLLARHFPADRDPLNELPDRPVLM